MRDVERARQLYGKLMSDAFDARRRLGVMTVNLYKTVHFIRERLYLVDANPRYATLVLWLRYNLPELEEYAEEAWDLLPVCALPFEEQTDWVVRDPAV